MAKNNNELASPFMDSFSCKICLKVLHDPVQCQNNEHHFCRKCITQHLQNSETCPLCMDQLTLATLRPPSRIILEIVSQLKKPRCRHVSRGCSEKILVEDVFLHEKTCGYAPVVCSNEDCKETVNRRDQESHETKECKFRKITCESCDEELVYVDYERHQCTLRKEMNEVRSEIDEVKSRLDEVTESLKQIVMAQGEMQEQLKAYHRSIKGLPDSVRHFSSTTIKRGSVVIKGQIYIFSGKSLEVFNWSTKAWTLIENCLFFHSEKSFSFLYGKRIMICGGGRIEFMNPSESGFTSNVFPGNLPPYSRDGVLFENRVITFGLHVQGTSLERPWKSTVLLEGNIDRSGCALERFGNNIFIIGFPPNPFTGKQIERYDINRNELTTLTTLPYEVYNMATVAYKDNIIILGGQSFPDNYQSGRREVSWHPLSDVVMYDIHSLECKRLPSMLQARSVCAAVTMGDVIVVMGGKTIKNDRGRRYPDPLQTAEYYVIGDTTWRELPAMNMARAGATAIVYE